MPISPNFKSIHQKEFEIYFSQSAPNQNLKYTDLCNLFQLLAAEHAEIGGISFTDMQQHHQAWVMSRMRIEIDELPKWKDIITIKTWIVSLENSRSVRAMEMYCGTKKLAGCETLWAVFNTKTRRPEMLELPHDHFEKFPENHPTKDRVKKIAILKDGNFIGERKVYLSDLDVVNHVNNVKYLEWCLDHSKNLDVLNTHFKSLDMNFIKEMTLNDLALIEEKVVENNYYYSVKSNDNLCFSLHIEI